MIWWIIAPQTLLCLMSLLPHINHPAWFNLQQLRSESSQPGKYSSHIFLKHIHLLTLTCGGHPAQPQTDFKVSFSWSVDYILKEKLHHASFSEWNFMQQLHFIIITKIHPSFRPHPSMKMKMKMKMSYLLQRCGSSAGYQGECRVNPAKVDVPFYTPSLSLGITQA